MKDKINAAVKKPPINSLCSLANKDILRQIDENVKGLGSFLRSDFLPVDSIMLGTKGIRGEGFSFF